jgi:hypothetical protein
VKAQRKVRSPREKIQEEITESLAEIDEEGLLFLLRQAQVIIHNQRVESLQREAQAAAPAGRKRGGASAKGEQSAPPESARPVVTMETAEGGKTVFLTLGKARKVLAPDEVKRLVRICWGAESKSEALRRLFTVLARERKDILADALIGHPDHPLLAGLFDTVRATWRLEDR